MQQIKTQTRYKLFYKNKYNFKTNVRRSKRNVNVKIKQNIIQK